MTGLDAAVSMEIPLAAPLLFRDGPVPRPAAGRPAPEPPASPGRRPAEPLELGRPIGARPPVAEGDPAGPPRTGRLGTSLAGVSVRWQILITCTIVIIAVAALSFLVIVLSARAAIEREMQASLMAAQRYVHEAISRVHVNVSGMRFLDELALDGAALRHARIIVIDTDRNLVKLPPALRGEGLATMIPLQMIRPDPPDVPPWFVRLLAPSAVVIEVPIIVASGRVGAVVIVGEPTEEISKVWEDTLSLGAIGLGGILVVLLVLHIALGRILGPLTAVSNGLVRLETGEFGIRLARPAGLELGIITDRFNALAERLTAAGSENSRLNRRLLSVQDDERQQIAHELHDEAGPCLFGMKATVRAIRRAAEDIGGGKGAAIAAELADLTDIIERLQTMNRRLFKRLRPMALGHVPLAELIGDIVADFDRHAPALAIASQIAPIAGSYGDPIDLTFYRCVQEGLTNVVRHSGARSVRLRLEETASAVIGLACRPTLRLSIADDGCGIAAGTAAGYGLSGIDERVRALGGTCTVATALGRGTTLTIEVPLDETVLAAES